MYVCTCDSTLLFRNRLQCRLSLTVCVCVCVRVCVCLCICCIKKKAKCLPEYQCMHVLFAYSLARLFHPSLSHVCLGVLYFVCSYIQIHTLYLHISVHVDGDKRCETFLNRQIEGMRIGGGREKRERVRTPVNMCISVCLMRSLRCVLCIYCCVCYGYARILSKRERKKSETFSHFRFFTDFAQAVLFFLDIMPHSHQLFTWVASSYFLSGWHIFFSLSRESEGGKSKNDTDLQRHTTARKMARVGWRERERLYWNVFQQIAQLKG